MFANELGKLAKTFSSAATAPSYRRCYTESPLWAAVLEWSRLLAEASPAANIPLTPQSAHRFIERGDKLDTRFAIEPYTSQYASMRASAQRVASRLDFVDKPIHQALEAYLDRELIGQLDCLDELGGTRYYLKTGSSLDLTAPTHVAFNYIVDHEMNTKRQRAERTKFRQKNRLAPHCELAKLIRAKLNTATDITGQNWNDVFSDIVISTLQFRDANPLMQLEIYSFALQVATKGSLDFEISHAAHSKAIQQASFIDHTAKWFDPKHQAGMTANNQAAVLLRQLLTLPVEKASHSELSPTTFGPLNLIWFGYLQQTHDNRWQVVASDRKNHPLNFFMVTHDTPQMRLQPIKATSDGFIEVQEGKNDLLEGRPIFFESSQDKHP